MSSRCSSTQCSSICSGDMYVTVCGCSLHSSQGRSLTQSTPRLPLRWARPSPAPFFGKLPLRSNQDLPLRMHQQRYRATSSPSSPAGNGKGGESPSPQVVSALVKVYSALKTLLGSIWELLTSPITAIKHSATWRRDQTRRTLKEHADRVSGSRRCTRLRFAVSFYSTACIGQVASLSYVAFL